MDRKNNYLVNFIIRAVFGMGLIFFANKILVQKDISVSVGLNAVSFCACGLLGLPGVGLLYGVVISRIL